MTTAVLDHPWARWSHSLALSPTGPAGRSRPQDQYYSQTRDCTPTNQPASPVSPD